MTIKIASVQSSDNSITFEVIEFSDDVLAY